MSIFIYDGYTEPGYIAPVGNVPAVRFHYRPAVNLVRTETLAQMGAATKRSAFTDHQEITFELITTHITKWDVRFPSDYPEPEKAGQVATINPETLKQMDPQVIDKLFAAVINRKSDVDPDAPKRDQDRQSSDPDPSGDLGN